MTTTLSPRVDEALRRSKVGKVRRRRQQGTCQNRWWCVEEFGARVCVCVFFFQGASLMRRGEVNRGLLLQVVGPNESDADVVSNGMMNWERAPQNA